MKQETDLQKAYKRLFEFGIIVKQYEKVKQAQLNAAVELGSLKMFIDDFENKLNNEHARLRDEECEPLESITARTGGQHESV